MILESDISAETQCQRRLQFVRCRGRETVVIADCNLGLSVLVRLSWKDGCRAIFQLVT